MFFFTDLDKLNLQTASQAFGPIAGDEDHSFMVTSKFTVEPGALAYMPVMGKVLVQPVDGDFFNATRLNVAIKVISPIENGYTPISYIIYRGIRRDSLLTTDNKFLPTGTTSLTTKLWQNWQDAQNKPGNTNTSEPALTNAGLLIHGPYGPGDSPPLLSKLFNDREGTFVGQLPTLQEGASLGTFDSQGEIGVDIILSNNVLRPNLALLEQDVNILTIPQGPHSVDNQTYDIKRKRSELLAYLDIAAIYALSAKQGVDCFYNGTRSTAKGIAQVHNTYLKLFHHQNTVFLDIRNEVSLPLNYYNEYKAPPDPVLTTPLFYLSQDENNLATTVAFNPRWPWPLYFLTYPLASHALSLAFSTVRNTEPLAYLEFGTLSEKLEDWYGRQARFIPLKSSDSNSKSRPLELRVSVVHDDIRNQEVNTCSICKCMILRQTFVEPMPSNSNAGAGPVRETYLDNIFGPVLGINDEMPQQVFAKRWMPLNSTSIDPNTGDILQPNSITGAIVQPSRVYTNENVIYQVQVLDAYSSADLEQNGLVSWSGFGNTISNIPKDLPFGPDEINSDQEATTLGAERRRIVLSTNSSSNLPLLEVGKSSISLSLCLTRTEHNALLNVITNNFDPNLGGIYCFFSTPIRENSLDETPSREVISTSLFLGGVSPGGLYLNLDEATMPVNQRVYSLDGLHFNSLASGQTSVVLPPDPQQEYSVYEFIDDIKAVESVYSNPNADERLDQTVTRVRVHYYGFIYEDLYEENPAGAEANFLKRILRRIGPRTIEKYTLAGAGTIFNHNVPSSDYWEADPAYPDALVKSPPTGILPYFRGDTPTDGYRVRQLYVSDGLSEDLVNRIGRKFREKDKGERTYFIKNNKRILNGTVLVDPGQNIVDLGHTLFTLDALFTSPDIAQRAPSRAPVTGLQLMGVTDGMWLANYLGDITGTLAVSYKAYYNDNPSIKARYTIQEFIEQQYSITSPTPDLAGDADAFGLYAVWANIFGKEPTTKFSDILAYYYSNDPAHNKEYTYKSRWKLFCLAVGFVTQTGSQYKWEPNETLLLQRMRPCYQVGYLAERKSEKMAAFILGAGAVNLILPPPLGPLVDAVTLEVLDRDTIFATPADMTFVMRKFLNQIKGLLQSEQASSNWNITY